MQTPSPHPGILILQPFRVCLAHSVTEVKNGTGAAQQWRKEPVFHLSLV